MVFQSLYLSPNTDIHTKGCDCFELGVVVDEVFAGVFVDAVVNGWDGVEIIGFASPSPGLASSDMFLL